MTNSRIVKSQDAGEQAEATYSETAVDHMRNPRNVGMISNADGQASITGPCGDTMEIWLRVEDGVIKQASSWTDGCGATIAAGSVTTELAKGKSAGEAFRITQQDVLKALGGLPDESVHCALLAANTMKEAVKDYLAFRNEPWKRAYRKC
ncbi:MAG: iron-sulfur cluster assembly scaffold protein [Dehalococcoidia bacterium]|nr:iron-sulfur cluster assembly scaffold protein [Dehalococcoidia bacterium]